MSVREALLDETLLELRQEQLNVALELRGVLDATGGKVAIDALLGELLESKLSHEGFGNGDLVGREFLINFVETVRP